MKLEFSWRYTAMGLAFASAAVVILVQITRLLLSPEAEKLRTASTYYARELHIYSPARGDIYDRWGYLLAGNQTVYEVGVDLNSVQSPETIAFAMSKVLMGHEEYNTPDYYNSVFTIASTETSTVTYRVLADYVTEDEVAILRKWSQEYIDLYRNQKKGDKVPSLQGLVFRSHLARSYPEKELASNILGFINRQGIGYGVEQYFNNLMAGEIKAIWMPTDPNKAEELPHVPEGDSLILTIDREIQASVEKILDNSINETGAESGTIVVMDPKTGEILAMASTPRIDLNQYWKYGTILQGKTPYNRAISEDYEPGSVYKVLTMAAALDSGAVKLDTTFTDTGVFEIGGILIHNWNWGAWGIQDMQGCMQHSLNVCLAWVGSQLGAKRFYSYMQNFGIGHLTGIDIAGEVPGRLKTPGDTDWYESDLGTNSFGQGVAVTPVQMAMAVSAVANDGKMMVPHILHAYVDKGYQYTILPQVIGTPISAKTAHDLTQLLAASLEEESSNALVPGYKLAGKTGTAEIPTPTGYTSDVTNASFVGWGPVDDPRFLVYVWLEKPTTSPWGSVVASPVFQKVVERLVVLMDIPPDDVRHQLNKQ